MFVNQKYHYVCLPCRRTVKGAPNWEFTLKDGREIWHTPPLACATCQGEMICLGKKFAAPKKRDDAQWTKLAWMIDNGWLGYDWPVSPAMNLNQVRESLRARSAARLAARQRQKQRDSFDEAARRARRNARHSSAARKREQCELRAQKRYQDVILARVKRES